MDNRSKNAVIKAFSVAAIGFSLSILFIGICFTVINVYVDPKNLLKIWAAFFIIGIITFAKNMVGSSKWALSKPFYVKNIVFMPLYLLVALILAMDLAKDALINSSYGLRLSVLILYAVLFLVIFTIRQLIEYYIRKKKTDEMNDALHSFQKEHSWDEEE